MGTSIQTRTPWVDHLRSFITLLVIAHHAALAYTSFSTFNPAAYILSTHPVVDTRRWPVLDLFTGFNDTFFMPLMFLISGMFTLPALRRKGAAAFLTDRFRRLFIPFLIAVTILMWVAYYPAWLLSGNPPGLSSYLIDFFTVEAWPVGPPWFIWVLFLFNLILAMLHKPLTPFLTRIANSFHHSLIRSFIFFIVLTILLYVPAAILFGSYTWTGLGPFDFQKSRLLLYFGYFLIGAVLGLADLERLPVKRWPWWIAASLSAYWVQVSLFPEGNLHILFFAMSIPVSCIACLTTFKAVIGDSTHIWRSLSANAYGMYLIHYIFIVWGQYALLHLDCPPGIKFLIVLIFSTLASWWVTQQLRKVDLIRGYL